jgi:2-hydroxy-3-keto-5-methylthiopentenyl-1-phosphate phosphatase
LQHDTLVICDFDGTVALQDAYYVLLQRYAGPEYEPLLEAFRRGELDSASFMERSYATLDAPLPAMSRVFDEIELDPAFSGFVDLCETVGWDVCIASDGLDWWIKPILERHGLGRLSLVCNRLSFTDDRAIFEFPWRDDCCPICAGEFAMCKRAVVHTVRDSHARVVFIGDGRSDRCAAGVVDHVFAKSDLADYCRSQAIPFSAFRDFSDVMRVCLS